MREELKAIAKTVIGGGAILLLLSGQLLLGSNSILALLLLYLSVLFAGLTVLRLSVILVQRTLCKMGVFSRPAVIVGTESNAQEVLAQVNGRGRSGFQVLGYIDGNHTNGPGNTVLLPLGTLDNLEDVLRKQGIREVLIAVDKDWHGSLHRILESAQNIEVNFRIKTNLLDKARGRKVVPLLEGTFYKVYASQMRTWEWGMKRLIDMAAAAVLLIATLPFQAFWVAKHAIKRRTLPYERTTIVGKNGKVIRIIELSSKGRKRIWHGIPVLLSVLTGDLSLIGPSWVRLKEEEDPLSLYSMFQDKLRVKPGLITPGGSNSGTSNGNGSLLEPQLTDIEYIEKMSFTSDLRILLQSFARPLSKSVH
jgi:lipopolysaccharide/colanic/teichoic acid biosynthesis glycosyltransferase